MLLFGSSLFALFTLVCVLSANFIGLVIARAFQGSPSIVSTLVVSVVLLGLFVLKESRASQALINPKLFHNLSFNLTLVLAIATYALCQACSYFLTL